MGNPTRERPTKKGQYKEPFDSEFKNIYRFLGLLDTGPFRLFYYDTDEKLYLQYLDRSIGNWTSLATCDKSGNIEAAGTVTGSATLKNPGRG